MLPGNLLITRRSGNIIIPFFAKLSDENLGLIENLIQTYKDNIGGKKGEIKNFLIQLEGLGFDYRFIRGLSTIIDRSCVFISKGGINPYLLRKKVFHKASEMGFSKTYNYRNEIINTVAIELGMSPEDLDSNLYSDMEEELILKAINITDSERLIKKYNLSLTQTLLFHAIEFKFSTSGNWQKIFRAVKFQQLMYEILKSEQTFLVKIDGPLSLFKLNRRYGISMAKILPIILSNERWWIEAKILDQKRNKLLDMKIDDRNYKEFFEQYTKNEEVYDSTVENDFALHFRNLQTGWELKREPEPIPTGKSVIIPDFSLTKAEEKLYLEIVGFWTEDYLKRKINKIEMIKDSKFILAVDSKLFCEEIERMKTNITNIIYYDGKIPLTKILSILNIIELDLKKKQKDRLLKMKLELTQPYIELEEFAKHLGVMEISLSEAMVDINIEDYIKLPGILIKNTKIKEIENVLKEKYDKGVFNLSEASLLFEKMGIKKVTSILHFLNYTIEWHGIDPSSAILKKHIKRN